MAEKEKRSLKDELRYILSLPGKAKNNDWDGIYDKGVWDSTEQSATDTDPRIAERASKLLHQQDGAGGVFDSVTDKLQPGTVPVKTETPSVQPENPTAQPENTGSNANIGTTDLLSSLLDPNYGAQTSEDVMGQYAAMTGGRPSSAAISAGTAAKADAEATLLRELLSAGSGSGTGSGDSVLSSLLSGGEVQQTVADIPEEYADFADLAGYETIVPVLEKMENNANMASYLADMVNKNVIDDATALEYLNRFEDVYEVTDAEGGADYVSMVQNVGGWTAVTDGGRNRSGTIDRNAKVKAPTGETLTLAQLYRALKKRGMEKDEARAYIIKLQNHLGI